MVFVDGVFQAQNVYSVSGTTLTFATAPANGRVITVYHSTTTVGGSNNTINTMTGDNSDTTLTLSVAPVHENNVQVYFDGVYQSKANYAISGTTLTFSTAPATGVLVEAITNTNTSSTTANQLLDADGDTKIQVEESSDEDKIRFDTGGTERVIIDSTGVGIGTSSPAQTLHTSGTGVQRIQIDATDNNAAGAGLYMKVLNSGSLVGNATIRVDNVGNIDFFNGTSSESQKAELSVGGDFTLNTAGKRYYIPRASDGAATGSLYSPSDSDVRLSGAGSSAGELQFEPSSGSGVAMAINSSGLIGMGDSPSNLTSEIVTITTPASGGGQGLAFKRLDTNSDQSVGQIRWSNNSTDDLAFIKVKTDGANTAGAMQFFTNVGDGVAEKMRINKSGQLLLNTTSNNSDTYKMVVNCDSGSKGIDVRNVSYNSDNGAFRSVPPGNTSYRFAVMLNSSNSTVGKIEVTSNSTTYTTSSDYRLKENITTLENGIDRLNKLKPVKFNWIESGQEEEGFIAHEVDEIFSDAVTGEKDAVQDNGTVSPQTMDYGRITPLLVKAIQEQQTIIEDLKTRIETLEG